MKNALCLASTILPAAIYLCCSSFKNEPDAYYKSEQNNITQPVFEQIEAPPASEYPDAIARNVILSLTCIAENDTTEFQFNYAENIDDGRGITFGIIGFTSGTFDGTILLKRIQMKDPSHLLCSYIPAFERIDNLHTKGHVNDVTGLDNFISDFNKYGNDDVVKKAQLELLDELYWNPAMKIVDDYGLKLNITKGQMYDASVRHGPRGAEEIASRTTKVLNGSPETGTNEIDWLKCFLVERKKYYEEKDNETGIIPRVDIMYQGVLDSGNFMLEPPFSVRCYDERLHTITGGQLVETKIKTVVKKYR